MLFGMDADEHAHRHPCRFAWHSKVLLCALCDLCG